MNQKSIDDILNNVEPPNYYELLGVTPDDFNLEKLQVALKKRMTEWSINQDEGKTDTPLAAQLRIMLGTTYNNLKTPESRAKYALTLQHATIETPCDHPAQYVQAFQACRELHLAQSISPDEISSQSPTESKCTAFATEALERDMHATQFDNILTRYELKLGQNPPNSEVRNLQALANSVNIGSSMRPSGTHEESVLTLDSGYLEVFGTVLLGTGSLTENKDEAGNLNIDFTIKRDLSTALYERLITLIKNAHLLDEAGALATKSNETRTLHFAGNTAQNFAYYIKIAKENLGKQPKPIGNSLFVEVNDGVTKARGFGI